MRASRVFIGLDSCPQPWLLDQNVYIKNPMHYSIYGFIMYTSWSPSIWIWRIQSKFKRVRLKKQSRKRPAWTCCPSVRFLVLVKIVPFICAMCNVYLYLIHTINCIFLRLCCFVVGLIMGVLQRKLAGTLPLRWREWCERDDTDRWTCWGSLEDEGKDLGRHFGGRG